MLGKITPYIFVGYLQVSIITLAAHYLFDVPIVGSLPLLFGSAFLFIAANPSVGFTFSTLARNQMQAMQISFFFFLPSLLLSGFMFPFRGMPQWAQSIGEILPLTHFLRIIRGVMLKGTCPTKCGRTCGPSRPSCWPRRFSRCSGIGVPSRSFSGINRGNMQGNSASTLSRPIRRACRGIRQSSDRRFRTRTNAPRLAATTRSEAESIASAISGNHPRALEGNHRAPGGASVRAPSPLPRLPATRATSTRD